jgi:hypothetical protein
MKFLSRPSLLSSIVLCGLFSDAANPEGHGRPEIPKIRDEATRPDWMTPIAGHSPDRRWTAAGYAIPEYNLRRRPVYMPGWKPKPDWQMRKRHGAHRLLAGALAVV